ncbi:hypothetical protein OR263_25560 [Streptomyces sp. NEAU-H22]|uniref:hypothetical protein n=1 Tax=Streptomyces sp. NEAU-H22 TaxID=2994655 RepID=UPI00225717DE|nr:hypothetical protein [Streptomyces sp. NEAU-H22]MCX3290038.1 hypothetical protein [Streptomyces sp. NEAU-H22]
MQNVPSRFPLGIARQLLADMDAAGNDDLTERDLCRLIGRCEVVIASLISVIEDGGER